MIAFTFIGTIIGAGFASGQEIKEYFVDYGIAGFFAFIGIAILFMLLGDRIMRMGYDIGADSYDGILRFAFSCRLRRIFDYVICFFLIATASTMFSGAGAFLFEGFGISSGIGSLLAATITVAVIFMGINKIMKFSSFVVPILILLTFFIAISSFNGRNLSEITLINELNSMNSLKTAFSGILYVSYNLLMGLSILPALGSKAKSKRQIRISAVMTGLIIGVFGVIIYFALLINYDKIQGVEIPIAALTDPSQFFMYGVSFVIAVITTAVGSLYGVYTRIGKKASTFLIISGGAYLISLLGFSNLVAKLYTVMGLFGIFIILMLLRGYKRWEISNNK